MSVTRAIHEARAAADSGANFQRAEFAKPIEEAWSVHDKIAASSGASQRATEQLCENLGAIIAARTVQAPRALLTVDLIERVHSLSYSEYRMVVGLMNDCRNDKSGNKLSTLFAQRDGLFRGFPQAVPNTIAILEHLYRSQFDQRNAKAPVPYGHAAINTALHEKFTEHTMMLLRTVHPLGVNIRNPSWRSAEGESGYPAHKLIGFQLGGQHGVDFSPRPDLGAVVVKPKNETSVVKFVPFGRRWDQVTEEAVLRNGESVIVGRPLSLQRELFGIQLSGCIDVPVGVRIPPEYLTWSRGSLFINRSEGGESLYILDRGTKSPIVTPDELGAIQTFIPRTVIEEGTVTFGESIRGERRRLGK